MKRIIFLLALLALPFGLRGQDDDIAGVKPISNEPIVHNGPYYGGYCFYCGLMHGHSCKPSALDTTGWEYEYTRIWQSKLCPEYWYCFVDSTPITEPRQACANSYDTTGWEPLFKMDKIRWTGQIMCIRTKDYYTIPDSCWNVMETTYVQVDSTPIVEWRTIDDWAKQHGFKKGRPQLKFYGHEEHRLVSEGKRYFSLDSAEYATLNELIAWWEDTLNSKPDSMQLPCLLTRYRAVKEKP